jgi:hypothetical protein
MAHQPRLFWARPGLLAVLLAVVPMAGCGGDRTYPVEGQVVFQGGAPVRELVGYTVMFESEGNRFNATGVVRPEGRFTVGTHQPGDGAVTGKHRVAISPPLPEGDRPPHPSLLPDRYARFETFGLEVEIKQEKNAKANIEAVAAHFAPHGLTLPDYLRLLKHRGTAD